MSKMTQQERQDAATKKAQSFANSMKEEVVLFQEPNGNYFYYTRSTWDKSKSRERCTFVEALVPQ